MYIGDDLPPTLQINLERLIMDFINIGSTPTEEDCFGVGNPLAQQECKLFMAQLEREFPAGYFAVKGFPHDFGRYYEVVAYLSENEADEDQNQAAYDAEGHANPLWDEISAPLVAALRVKAA